MKVDRPVSELLELLRARSVFHGNFTLASGGTSKYYVDCKLTTLDARGAWLTGEAMHALIRREEAMRNVKIDSLGGLTMGSDPIALAVAMYSFQQAEQPPLRMFSVRKAPKAHGQTKLIEGNFKSGDTTVIIDDVVTRGESTIAAINAVVNEGGKIAFIAVLVDREEGGRAKIESMGYPVVSLFRREQVFAVQSKEKEPASVT